MKFDLIPDHPVTDAECKRQTGKTLKEWVQEIDSHFNQQPKRRDITVELWRVRGVDPWWATTIAVEYERHHDMVKKDGLYEGYSICSTKTLNAPPSKVFQAWVDLGQMKGWMGGKVSGSMEEGAQINTGEQKYDVLRVREDKDLRFDFHDPAFTGVCRIDVAFEPKGDKTLINVHHKRLQNREEADGARNTWAEAMNRLKVFVE